MIRYVCDRCGRELSASGADRYIARFELYAAGGPLEFTADDLRRDPRQELDKVLKELASADADGVEDQTYRCLRFDLCVACHREVLANPWGRRPDSE